MTECTSCPSPASRRPPIRSKRTNAKTPSALQGPTTCAIPSAPAISGDFVLELPAFRPLEIYDRNYGKNDPNYQFPAEYRPYIVGTLPFDQIEKAYKGYRYAINLNSIKQSQSMFARRVFELLASNTITISNFSRGVRLLFGDLVITTDSGAEVVRRLNKLADNEPRSRKFRLAGLRKVMSEHTYGQRLAYLVSKVSGKAVAHSLPHMAVLAYVGSQRELDAIQANYQRQRYANTSLYVVVGEGMIPPVSEDPRVHLVKSEQAKTDGRGRRLTRGPS